jgi:hypothetical protein
MPPPTLTKEQTAKYYAEEGSKATPASPKDWLAKQGGQQSASEQGLQIIANKDPESADRIADALGYGYRPSTIASPTPAPGTATAPVLPEPNAPAIQESFFTSSTENVKTARTAVEASYKQQIDQLNREKDEANKKIADFTAKQENVLEQDIKPLTQPFREDLENTERQRLYVNENFEANQTLTRELDQLLTEGNELIARKKAFGGVSFVRNARIQESIDAVTGRAGVIQAVMSARSGQIAEAYRMIDRSVEARNADRRDQLAYYEAIFDFYENGKDEQGKKLVTIEDDKKSFIKAQIGLLENDLSKADEYAENIKNAMSDPDTALLYAQAGVSLSDSPAEISQKVAEASYSREVRDLSNEMALSGFSFLAPGQSAPAGAQLVTATDSKGVEKSYYKKGSTGGSNFSNTQVNKGASNAGLTPEEFGMLPVPVQNLFVNNVEVAEILAADVLDYLEGSLSYEEAVEDIEAQNVPGEARDYFIQLLGQPSEGEDKGGGFWDWVGSFFR